MPRLARLINRIRPRILFSGGNHFHLTAGLAYRLAGSPKDIGYMGRASNAAAGRERLGFLAALLPSFDRLKYAGINPVIAVADELGRKLFDYSSADNTTVQYQYNGFGDLIQTGLF